MASPSQLSRPFSTAARVHPAIPVFHPQIVAKMQSSVASSPSTAAQRVKMLGRRVALPATGVLALGMAVSAYVDKRQYSSPATSHARVVAEQQQKQRNDALTAAYGDRSSLEDIQKAMEMYEAESTEHR